MPDPQPTTDPAELRRLWATPDSGREYAANVEALLASIPLLADQREADQRRIEELERGIKSQSDALWGDRPKERTWRDLCLDAEAERDQARARVKELEGALREARDLVWHNDGLHLRHHHRLRDCAGCAVEGRIDALLHPEPDTAEEG